MVVAYQYNLLEVVNAIIGIFKDDVCPQIKRISRFIFREPSLDPKWLLEHQLCFREDHRRLHLSGPSARIPMDFRLFGETFCLLARGHFGRDGEGTFGEKNDRPKSSKNKKIDHERNAQHQARADLERNRHRQAPAPGRPQSRRLRVELM